MQWKSALLFFNADCAEHMSASLPASICPHREISKIFNVSDTRRGYHRLRLCNVRYYHPMNQPPMDDHLNHLSQPRHFYPTCPTALVAMIGCTGKHPMRRLQCVVPYVCIYVCMSQMRCASNNPAAVFLRLQSRTMSLLKSAATKSVSPNTACGVKVCIERFLLLLLDKRSTTIDYN